MTRLRVLLYRLNGFFRKGSLERDLDEELHFHLQMETSENVRKGMTLEDAKSAALRRFGGVAQIKETYREVHSLPAIEVVQQDVCYGIRMLRKRPGFALAAVVSLALGIGANTAIFSVVYALLLKPLPYPDPDRLAILWACSPGTNNPHEWSSPGQYMDLRAQNHSFEEISISQGRSGTLVTRDQPERIEALLTSSSLFRMLGAKPLYGRLLLPEDDKPGTPAVVLLSYDIWKRLFNSDPKIVGQAIVLNGLSNNGMGAGTGRQRNLYTVAGVLSPEFLLNQQVLPTNADIGRMDVFLPLAFGADAVNRRGSKYYNLMVRLRPSVTMRQAQADVSVIADSIREKDKRDPTFSISVVPLLDQVVGDVRRGLLVLLGAVALVLLIACANVANLLLSRATSRRSEVAIRMALGAGRQRLVLQLLTESMLLGLMGGAAGLLIAKWILYVVRTVHPGNIPLLEIIGIDAGVLVFTFGVSMFTGVVFGLAPALRAARVDLNSALKAGGRLHCDSGFNTSRHRLRSMLVVSELAFSLMLLIGAGLLIRSFVRLLNVSPGFNPDHVISMRLGSSSVRSPALEQQVLQKISVVPGVKAIGAITSIPFTPGDYGWWWIGVEGFTPQTGQEQQVELRAASADYFRTMEIPLLKGRFLSNSDAVPNAQPVILVDAKFAQHFWPGSDPIGKHVWNERIGHPFRSWREAQNPLTIVGVVGTVKQYGLDVDSRMVLYAPSLGLLRYVVARTSSDPMAAARGIVREIHRLDPAVPVDDIRTMEDRINNSLAQQRFSTVMLGAFAVLALILALVGLYGVMSYLVMQSTHDLGVRIALGAQPSSIIRMVVRQGMELAGVGIAAGIIGALAMTRVMASMLFAMSATDIVTFSVVPLILAAMTLFATYLPARRATQVDAIVVLRED